MKAASRLLDGSAIGLSGLCMVHCLALPVLAALSPALSVVQEAEWIHLSVVLTAAPLSAFALLRPPHGQKRDKRLIGLAGAGIALLAAGLLVGERLETVVSVAGGLCLASAHFANWRRHSRCAID